MQTMLRGRLGRTLATGAAALLATAFAVAAPAHATDQSYECASCGGVGGANNFIDEAAGTDYTYTIVFVHMWKFNGGSNYNLEAESHSEAMSHVKICTGSKEFNGHGDTTAGGLLAHLSGREANYKDCRIP